MLGGGAFGNRDEWIIDAIKKALEKVKFGLDVYLCHYRRFDNNYVQNLPEVDI